jgi:hypothetical protein
VLGEKGKMSKKEQILEYFKDINVAYNDYTMHDTLEHMLEDLEEVRRGRWEWDEDGIDWNIGAWKCSECRSTAEAWWAGTKNVNPYHCSGHRYCSNCGAIMDEAIDTPTDPVAK